MAIPTSFRAVLRGAKNAARELACATWEAGFVLARGVRRERARRWSSAGGGRVLVVAPHPDDETAGCGGTLALHAAQGDEVAAVVVTDGRRSRALGLSPDEMARRRKAEAEEAIGALGVRLVWLGLPEGEWRPEELTSRLADELRSFSPGVLYAPSRVDFHPEHVRVAHALASAVAGRLPPEARVRVFAAQVPLTSILANVASDVSQSSGIDRALAAYATQAASVQSVRRQHRYAAAFHGVGSLADEFWELSPKAYVAIHRGEPAPEPWRTFRGVRYEPWTDPLAYLVGRAERRRLARLAGHENRSR